MPAICVSTKVNTASAVVTVMTPVAANMPGMSESQFTARMKKNRLVRYGTYRLLSSLPMFGTAISSRTKSASVSTTCASRPLGTPF